MYHFYQKNKKEGVEYCFNVETLEKLSSQEEEKLKSVLAEDFEPDNLQKKSFLNENKKIIEIGPRLNFATAFSTNAVAIFHSIDLKKVLRVEKSTRYVLLDDESAEKFVKKNADKMTEMSYEKPLESFKIPVNLEKVFEVKLLEEGKSALKKMNSEMGLGMDDWDIDFYYQLFVKDLKRNPTNVECFQLGQANSEHSRHWFFKGKLVIDGENIDENLFEIVQASYKNNPINSVIAFSDNSSAIRGERVKILMPKKTKEADSFEKKYIDLDSTFTAETHNFPTGIAPKPGAETGSGGRIRDNQATGRGAHVVAGTAGYCVGNLQIPNYNLPWENKNEKYPKNLASSLKIAIDASNGASDYGNKFGEPLIQGFTRSFGLRLPNGERREWLKPIMFTGGVGHIDHTHLKKGKPKKDMLIIQIGGPMYRIGVGGGAASSMIQGENKEELDFNAVQRGDAEMSQKMNRVVRACVEMGEKNPIISIHDQGAGGPCNVITEIVESTGGRVDVRKINVGDKTMSVLEIWSAEAQERSAILIQKSSLKEFVEICERENSLYEVLGKITDDGRIILEDSKDNITPVNLELKKILGKMPQKTFTDKTEKLNLQKLEIDKSEGFLKSLEKVLSLLSVGSKRFLTSKVDRSVSGLIAQQQCIGPLQLPLSNVSVVARSLNEKTGGTAISIGEQPIKTLINPKAGARMSVGEALTNLVFAKISKLENVKCSGNWMWAAKLPGEVSNIYYAAKAMSNIMIEIGIALDGGKDSLSMATKVDQEIVKSPGELTISAYVDIPDVRQIVTPNIKDAGKSFLYFMDLGEGKNRMGGSSLAQVNEQIGNESPDVDNVSLLKNSFEAVQEMIEKKAILAGHDKSDGGLIITVLEMAFAGNCGLKIYGKQENPFEFWFNEELGIILEISNKQEKNFLEIIEKYNLQNITSKLAETTKKRRIKIGNLLDEEMPKLRQVWEETSHQLNLLQTRKKLAQEEKENIYKIKNPEYNFISSVSEEELKNLKNEKSTGKPKIAIIREEGSNGDREMAAAFFEAGFETWDVTMSDLLTEKISLKDFRGLAFVGGFSYADTLGSAKGWAAKIKFNEKLSAEFRNFYKRKDTFSLGICNGCQLMGLLGWVPGKFTHNNSGRFESRWTTVKILESPAIMLKNMAGSVLGAWVAHGEGKIKSFNKKLGTVIYLDDENQPTEKYPFNPNGSKDGITGLCSADGRHLAMMPHPERTFLKWQWPYMSEKNNIEWQKSPWLQMFQNARKWCDEN